VHDGRCVAAVIDVVAIFAFLVLFERCTFHPPFGNEELAMAADADIAVSGHQERRETPSDVDWIAATHASID